MVVFFKQLPEEGRWSSQDLLPQVDQFVGLRFTRFSDAEKTVEAELTVSPKNIQPFGLLHGGVSCLVAESVASVAANLSVEADQGAVGQSLTANHLRSARLGETITITARNVHAGGRSQVWNLELCRDGELISQVTMTMSIIRKKG